MPVTEIGGRADPGDQADIGAWLEAQRAAIANTREMRNWQLVQMSNTPRVFYATLLADFRWSRTGNQTMIRIVEEP